jgi:DNA-binding transcriptional LysR family regulator
MTRNLTQLNVNLLVALDALLEERNLTRAGKGIGLSQPAMSAALSQLREIFEDRLLVRVGRGYELTKLAADLADPLRRALLLLERAIAAPGAFDQATADREFSIAVSDYVLMMLVPSLIATMAAAAPRVRLTIVPLGATDPPRLPAADLFIVPSVFQNQRRAEIGPEISSWRSEEVFRDRWVFAVARDNPDVGRRVTLQSVAKLRHVRYAVSGVGGAGEGHLDALAIDRRIDVTVGSYLAAIFLLRGTRLVTLAPERLVRRLERPTGVRIVRPAFRIPDLVECMMWSPVLEDDAAHQWLRAMVRDVSVGP